MQSEYQKAPKIQSWIFKVPSKALILEHIMPLIWINCLKGVCYTSVEKTNSKNWWDNQVHFSMLLNWLSSFSFIELEQTEICDEKEEECCIIHSYYDPYTPIIKSFHKACLHCLKISFTIDTKIDNILDYKSDYDHANHCIWNISYSFSYYVSIFIIFNILAYSLYTVRGIKLIV